MTVAQFTDHSVRIRAGPNSPGRGGRGTWEPLIAPSGSLTWYVGAEYQ